MMRKKVILLLGLVAVAVCSSVSGAYASENVGIEYIEKGFYKDQSVDLIGNYTIQQFTTMSNDEFEIKLKRQEGIEEHNDKNYDLRNIPCRLYEKTDEIWIETNYTLIDTKYFNLKTKEEDTLCFSINKPYDCYKLEIGFGTVTYEGVSDIIQVTGGSKAVPITLTDIYNADVAGGWNQFYKLNNSCFSSYAKIYIGNTTNTGYLEINQECLRFLKDFANNDNAIGVYDENGFLYIYDSSIYIEDTDVEYHRIISADDAFVECENSLLVQCGTGGRGELIPADNDISTSRGYYNYTSLIGVWIYNTKPSLSHFYNCKVIDGRYGVYDCQSIDLNYTSFKDIQQETFQSINTGSFYNVYLDDCIKDIGLQNDNPVSFYDCSNEMDNNTFWINHGTSTDFYQYNSFRLQTDEDTDIYLYYNNGTLALSSIDDDDGYIESWVLCGHSDESQGDGYGINHTTPFRLIIEKNGYVTYNGTFNNSFKPMDYQIYLMEGEIMNIEMTVPLSWLGLLLVGLLYIVGVWKRDIILMFFGGILSLAVGIFWLVENPTVFSIGFWIGVLSVLLSIWLMFIGLYFAISKKMFDF